MRRLPHVLAPLCALFCTLSSPALAQVDPAKEGVDGLRLALESVGLLLSVGDAEPGSMRIPQVRVFNATTTPIHWDIRLDEVVFEPSPEGLMFRLPASFTAAVRWGEGAEPWVVSVSTQDAVFGLVRGPEGALDGLAVTAVSLEAVSQPGSPGVFVAVANGLSMRNVEVGSAGFEETWSWDDAGLRASVPQSGGRLLELDIESSGVDRSRRGEQYGWTETLPWMAAIDRGMEMEETWSIARLAIDATTSVQGRVDRDAVALRDGAATWRHARTGFDGRVEATGLALKTVRGGVGWAVDAPSASLALRLPTHPMETPQDWSVAAKATGTALHAGAPLPFALDVEATGRALMPRPLFGRVGTNWGWFPVLSVLDAVEADVAPSSLALAGQELRGEGRVSVMPNGVAVGMKLDGSGDGWASAVDVWGGWPVLAGFLSSDGVAQALAGPGPRSVGWSEEGFDVEPVAP
jgi:hypothetical protein